MRQLLMGMLVALLATNGALAQKTEEFTVATFNIRYDNPADAPDTWNNRFPAIAALVQFHEFDILGIQEGLFHQVQQLESALTDFTYLGVGRNNGKKKGEYAAIFYKTAAYEVLDSGTFWLAEDSSRPNKGWDASQRRICTWAKMKSVQSGQAFFVFNTHFDHKGAQARIKSTALILEKIRQIASDARVILIGDFNLDQDSASYKQFVNEEGIRDAYLHADFVYANSGTFNQFDTDLETQRRIDHIFVKGDFAILKYGILTDTYRGHFPSDHFPVMVRLAF